MTLHRSALATLALFTTLPLLAPGVAHARSKRSEVPPNMLMSRPVDAEAPTLWALVPDEAGEVVTVTGDVDSEGAEEHVTLVESDAWLHGSTALAAEPSVKASVSLTLYDDTNAPVVSFTGAHLGGGSVIFTADATVKCDASTLTCNEARPTLDVEVLAASVFPTATGYELVLDLNGADTWEVAYAEVVVTESTKERTVAEVGWSAVGAVWTADLDPDHTGVIDVKLQTRDAGGEKLDTLKAELGQPWTDDGEGVSTLVADEDPLSSVALVSHSGSDLFAGGHVRTPRMTVVSEDWDTSTYPTHAELELAGESGTVAVNTYQRLRKRPELVFPKVDAKVLASLRDGGSTLSVTVGSVTLSDISARLTDTPVCSAGTCVALVDTEAGYGLSVTAYATSVARLPTKADLSVVMFGKSGEKLASETGTVEYEDEVSAVFVAELELEGDPIGQDASGKVKLLGAATKKGKQETLSKGKFKGVLSRDADGDLGFGGTNDADQAQVDTSFAVLLGGAVECGGDGCDGDWAPPVVLYRDRIGAYVVGIRRVSASVKLKGSY